MKLIHLIILILGFILLSSCSTLSVKSSPTVSLSSVTLTLNKLTQKPKFTSTPTIIDIETSFPTSTSRPSPTNTVQPSLLLKQPSSTPSPTNDVVSTKMALSGIPEADIQIFFPGESSKVISPIPILARIRKVEGKVYKLELRGEDGRLITRHVERISKKYTDLLDVGIDMEFEISALSEKGRLIISVEDEQGQIISLNSIDLELHSRGNAKISHSEVLFQKIVIKQPSPESKVSDFSIQVYGKLHPNIVNILRIELIGENGRTLGHRIGNIVDGSADDYNTFFAEVPYFATEIQPATLIVYEDGNTLSAIKHLSSVELLLSP